VRHEEEELLEAERSGLAFERGASEAPVSSPTDVALARAVGAFDALGDAQQHLLAPWLASGFVLGCFHGELCREYLEMCAVARLELQWTDATFPKNRKSDNFRKI